jgi:methionyl-tRNA synthetase
MCVNKKRQATGPCKKCRSWYAVGNNCNVCGADRSDDPPEPIDKKYNHTGAQSLGRAWDKKKHKYVT